MQNKATILLIDDTKENIDVLLTLLQGYDLIPCLDATQALQLAQTEPIDLILLDIIMPQIDGFEVCARLKANPATASIPVIFLSAKEETEAIEKGFALGGADYIAKPFKPKELLVRIKNHLELQSYKNELEIRVKEEIEKTLVSQQLMLQQSKQAALGELLMHISHQWKQPLSELSSITTLMHSNLALGVKFSKNDTRTTLQRLDEIIDFMAQTIGTFENFYKPANIVTEFSARQSTEKTLSLLQPTFYYDCIDVTLEVLEACSIQGNENHFSQILFSLLNNAREMLKLRAIPSARVSITITHNAISVCDNAQGIAQEHLTKIFEPFFSTKGSSGCGLYLANSIAQKNGWNLRCDNIREGALFTLEVQPCKH